MPYDLTAGDAWAPAGDRTLYRFVLPDRTYGPVAPWPGHGRFDCGPPTLYFSHSASGALAEYYRRHPELLRFQEGVKLRLYEVGFSGESHGLDVSEPTKAEDVGIPWERLRSSDRRTADRFRQCQQLGAEVVDAGGCSILFPSAAYDDEVNLVSFGDMGAGWTADEPLEVDRPLVEPTRVRPLPAGAEP